MKSTPAAEEWERLQRMRQAVRDAASCPARIRALCAYQGALHGFIDRHAALIELALAPRSAKAR